MQDFIQSEGGVAARCKLEQEGIPFVTKVNNKLFAFIVIPDDDVTLIECLKLLAGRIPFFRGKSHIVCVELMCSDANFCGGTISKYTTDNNSRICEFLVENKWIPVVKLDPFEYNTLVCGEWFTTHINPTTIGQVTSKKSLVLEGTVDVASLEVTFSQVSQHVTGHVPVFETEPVFRRVHAVSRTNRFFETE